MFRHALRGEELRQGPRGNGGPALVEPPAVALSPLATVVIQASELLCGDRWKEQMAGVFGVGARQLRRWESGEAQPHEHAKRWARKAAEERIAKLQAIVAALADPVPAGPQVPPAPPAPAAPARAGDPRQIDIEDCIAAAIESEG